MDNRVTAQISAKGKRIGIVVSRWNEMVTRALLDGALDELKGLGDPKTTTVFVPGSWEIPLAAKALIDQQKCDGVIALGCIMQGATTHAALLANDAGAALMNLQMTSGKPVSWGILTPENQEQALERAGMKLGNKGREAARAVVEMISLLDALG